MPGGRKVLTTGGGLNLGGVGKTMIGGRRGGRGVVSRGGCSRGGLGRLGRFGG